MKRSFATVCAVAALLALATAVAWATTPPAQNSGPDLVPLDISWSPSTVFPGDAVSFSVTVENGGAVAVGAADGRQAGVKIVLTTRDAPQREIVAVEQAIPNATGLMPGATTVATGTLIAPAEGGYRIVATLDPNEVVAETDEENNARSELFDVKAVLPAGLGNLFAGLGMFAAVMAIMAVGTEAVLETLKLFLGLKRKITALEALDKMEKLLPGQLAALGVDPVAQGVAQGYIQKMRTMLKPVTGAAQAVAGGRLHDTFLEIQTIAGVNSLAALANVQLRGHVRQIKNELVKFLYHLQTDLNLDDAFVGKLKADIERTIDAVAADADILQALDAVTSWLQQESPALIEEWLSQQADASAGAGHEALLALFDAQVIPVLEGLGLDASTVSVARSELDRTLQVLQSTFLEGLQNLLKAVEVRRGDVQSPIRKLWRLFREPPPPALGVVLTPTNAAQVVLEQEDYHRDVEASRLRILRLISVFVGTLLAFMLQVDAAVLLDTFAPGISGQINRFLDVPIGSGHLTAGIILTGLAASAGSAFWHDQLEKLQLAKREAEAVARLVRQVKAMQEPKG